MPTFKALANPQRWTSYTVEQSHKEVEMIDRMYEMMASALRSYHKVQNMHTVVQQSCVRTTWDSLVFSTMASCRTRSSFTETELATEGSSLPGWPMKS